VVVAAISQEVGAAFAVGLFAALGAIGAAFIRFLVAGVILCVATRPRLRGLSRRAWLSAAALAATLTVMNVCFYNSLTRIPLGVAVTIEALGPLALSVAVSSRKTAWLWALLALAGVAMLSLTGVRVGHLDPVGLGFAAGAAASWAGYILAMARAGTDFPNLDGLALATAIGAVVTAPFAVLAVDPTRRRYNLGITRPAPAFSFYGARGLRIWRSLVVPAAHPSTPLRRAEGTCLLRRRWLTWTASTAPPCG